MNTTPKIASPSDVKVEWVVRYGSMAVDIVDPYVGLADETVLVSERGSCMRCDGAGQVSMPGAGNYRNGQCFQCKGSGGKHETSTVADQRRVISTHPAVLAKLMDETAFVLENSHRFTEADLAKFPARA